MLDVSLKRTTAGKFTFDWGPDGDLRFDPYGVYSVFSTLLCPKGSYYWDSTGLQGTLLYQVKQDRLRTASQLVSYSRDGLSQCEAAGVIGAGSATAERRRSGSYVLTLNWPGLPQPQRLEA